MKRRKLHHTWLLSCVAALLGGAGVAWGQEADDPAGEVPPEEQRLDSAAFREGLKKRGLTELLELHLREFPPKSAQSMLLLQREIKLAEAADPTLSRAERRAALATANDLLETIIERSADDPRRYEWRFDLLRSRVYEEAEPHYTNILYREGTQADREALGTTMQKVMPQLAALQQELSAEADRLDALPIGEFERLEAAGYVERIDTLAPQVEYLSLWARFYDSLHRRDEDTTRLGSLRGIVEALDRNGALTPTQAGASFVPALLLAGMSERRLGTLPAAREHLERAIAVADRITDSAERQRIDWAVTLAWIECVRADRDAREYDRAMRTVEQFRLHLASAAPDEASWQLVAALLERSVHRARAERAARQGSPAESARYQRRAWEVLEELVRQMPAQRDGIYATVYELCRERSLEELDPFEECATVAGLLTEASTAGGGDPAARERLLDRAIQAAERFLSAHAAEVPTLTAEVTFNMGVALYRRGRNAEAARAFIEVAQKHPGFDEALRAAELAVQIAAQRQPQPGAPAAPASAELYRDALATLTTHYAGTPPAQYWRFYYAQVLEEAGAADEAAVQYQLVTPDHEHYAEAQVAHVRCRLQELQALTDRPAPDVANVRRLASEVLDAQRELSGKLQARLAAEQDPARQATLKRLVYEARVIAAEVQILPSVDQPARALELLSGDTPARDDPQLMGRALRVRLLALEQLGRLSEAAAEIPRFVAADPQVAGPTLQSIYRNVDAEVRRLEQSDAAQALEKKAQSAWVLAQQIRDWAREYGAQLDPAERRAIEVQWAEANLRVGEHEAARAAFEELMRSEPIDHPDIRVALGLAESRFELGDLKAALPLFNQMAMSLPAEDPLRWQALLRDLQCRTGLQEDPRGILKVLDQQAYFHPELGGPRFKPQFDRLRRENEQRLGDAVP